MQTTIPKIAVTNYQQYVNGQFLQEAIAEVLDSGIDAKLPEYIYVSIAYIDIKKVAREQNVYMTKLVLSINGKSYDYTLLHSNTDAYLAKMGLDVNQYANQAIKDDHIRLLNQAFESVVFFRTSRIIDDLIANNIKLR